MESVVNTNTLHVSLIRFNENVWADKPEQNRQHSNDTMAARRDIILQLTATKTQYNEIETQNIAPQCF
jgi:hypothetical protein